MGSDPNCPAISQTCKDDPSAEECASGGDFDDFEEDPGEFDDFGDFDDTGDFDEFDLDGTGFEDFSRRRLQKSKRRLQTTEDGKINYDEITID